MADFEFSTGYRCAAIILFPLALFGFLCNLTVVVFLRVIPSLNNSFGSLTLSQAAADCAHQAIFVFYLAPCIFLHNDALYSLSGEFGFVLIIIYEICGMSHVFISINRFVAVNAPFVYSRVFSQKNTRILIGLYWTIAIASTTFCLKILDCSVYLAFSGWIFIYKDTPACQAVSWYADFLKYVVYVVIVAVLDGCAIMRIHFINTRHTGTTQDTVSAMRRRRERNLVYQTSLQGIFFISELITYFVLCAHARNKWEAFFLGTMSWCMVHAMDGFIVLSCNQDFRKQIKKTIFAPESAQHETVSIRSVTPRAMTRKPSNNHNPNEPN